MAQRTRKDLQSFLTRWESMTGYKKDTLILEATTGPFDNICDWEWQVHPQGLVNRGIYIGAAEDALCNLKELAESGELDMLANIK